MALLLPLIVAWSAFADDSSREAFLGTWRGSSTCVNREAAPACRDETVVYDVRAAKNPATATLAADKIVDGKREPMGEFDFTYSTKDGCWRTEFETPRFHGVWCLSVDKKAITGSLKVLPGQIAVREVRLSRN